jgi:uncharacterized repeat protein (TIGR01451 family)
MLYDKGLSAGNRSQHRAVLLACALLGLCSNSALANVSVTAASGGTGLSADKAQNGATSAFTTLGNIIIQEGATGDFAVQTNKTLILTAPSGWRFNAGTGGALATRLSGSGASELVVNSFSVTASNLTVNLTVTGTAQTNSLTLTNIQVQAIEGGALPSSGTMLRTTGNPGTATITGITSGSTTFAALSQAVGALRLFTVLPGQLFTDAGSVAASGISGAALAQTAGTAFNLPQLVAADREFNIDSTYSGGKTIGYTGPGGNPSYTTSVGFSSGLSTNTLTTLLTKAETTTLTATDGTVAGVPSSNLSVGASAFTKLQLLAPGETSTPGTAPGKTGAPLAQTAGVAFNVVVKAVDDFWNVAGTVTDTVSFSSSDASATLPADAPLVSGTNSLSVSLRTLGTQTLTASDISDSNKSSDTSPPITVQKPTATTTAGASPSVSCLGQPVTFSVAVAANGSDLGTPTGTVDFKDGSTVMDTETLDGSGQASFSTSSLAAGSHSVTVQYSGDANFNGSTSLVLTETVNTAAAVTTNPGNQNVCVGNSAAFTASASGSPLPAVQWQVSTDGGLSFTNISGATNNTYTFAASLSDNGKQYAALFSNSCGTALSTAATLTANPKPTATVTGSTTICAGSSAAIQAALTGTAPWTVVWSDGVTNANVSDTTLTRSVSPSSSTTYSATSVSDANCTGTASGSAGVTVNTAPSVTANPTNKSVCAGSSVSFIASASGSPAPTVQWQVSADNGGTFTDVPGATGNTYTFATSGSDNGKQYRAQFTNACGGAASTPATLTVNALPICSISGADAVCANSSSDLYSGPAGLAAYRWTIGGSATISGAANSQSVSVNAGASGSFTLTLTLTNASGCTATCSKTVANLALPTAVVSGSGTICPGNSTNIQAALTGAGPWTVTWSDGVTQSNVTASPATRSVSPSASTTYTVTSVSDVNCAGTASGSAVVTVNTLPSITANPTNKIVCAGSSVSFAASASGSPTPGVQWQVSVDGGATFTNILGATSSTYTFTASLSDNGKQFRAQFTNTCGGATSTAAALTVNALPACAIAGADAVCANSSNDLYSGPAGMTAYRWSVSGSATISGATNAQSVSINAGASGSFTLTLSLTNASGCSSTCSKTVTILSLPTAVVSGGGTICPGNSANIQATLTGTGPWTLTWSDGVTQANVAASPATRSVSPTSTTTYSVTTVTDANCANSGTGSATVTVNSAPLVTSNPTNRTVCAGSSVSFTGSASGSPTPGVQWQVSGDGGATFTNIAGATSSTYTFTASLSDNAKRFRAQFTNSCGTAFSSAAVLTVIAAPSAAITAAAIVCGNSSGNIASVPSAGAGAGYAWTVSGGTITAGAGTSIITYTAGAGGSITISVTVTNAQGCSASSSQVVAFASQGKDLEAWKNKAPIQWQNSTFNDGDHQYAEGNSIPMRLELLQMCPGASWCVVLRFDFKDGNTSRHFYDFLSTYNSSESTVAGQECANFNCSGVPTMFPIPTDTSLPYQLPGNFTVYNGAITNVSAYSTISGSTVEKQLTISGTTASGGGAKDVLILFGGHLGRENEWGVGNGASSFPGASAKVLYQFCGDSSFGNFAVNPAGIIKQADLSITKTAAPNPLCAGNTLTYSLVVANSGPNQASPVTVLDPLPAGTTLNSVTMSQGSYTGTTNLNLALGAINAGSNATISIVVNVNTNGGGTLTNTATVSAGAPADPFTLNNTATALTMVFPRTAASPLSDQAVCLGAPATFSTTAFGAAPFAYQWRKNGANLAGATNSSFSVASVSAGDVGTYCVTVSGSCGGMITSVTNCASLTLSTNASTSPLAGAVKCPSDNVSFSTTPAGTGPFSFVWRKDGAVLSGAKANTLSLTNVTAADAGAYCVEVSGACGTANACASLTVLTNTTVEALTSQTKCPGETATFTAIASGTGPFSYLWKKDGVALSGQTNSLLTLASVGNSDDGSYCVEVSGNCGRATNCATLSLYTPATADPLVSQTNCPGSTVTFSTMAHGSGPFTYQWLKDGTPLNGQTGAALVLSNISGTDAGTYAVQVNGLCNGITNSATLTVNQNAFVASAPTSVTTCPGTSASFSVSAGGTGPFACQWFKDGAALDGATNTSLVLNNVGATDVGAYSVVVRGVCGDPVTNSARLDLYVPTTADPLVSQTNCPGTTVSFSTVARGTGPFTYQWRKDGAPLPGETGSSLTLAGITAASAGSYSVDVTGNCNRTTQSAILAVNVPTTADPLVSQTNCPGAMVSLSTVAHGTGPFTYQWRKDGKALLGGTQSSFVISSLSVLDVGTYSVTVSGLCNAVTNSAALTVDAPTTATPLANQTVCFGRTATFTTTPSGTGPFSFVWKKDGSLLPGQTGNSLSISNVKAADAGAYTVEVSGHCNSTTNSATLAIQSDGLASPATFANPNPIAIPDFSPGVPYPSAIEVMCVPSPVGNVTVTITNLNHTYASDVDILLVSPSGQAVMLMADTGDANPISNAVLGFSDAAPGFLPEDGPIVTGVYKPTNYGPADHMPAPAPPGPYSASLSAFTGTDPNGTWALYVADDTQQDSGSIVGGWSLALAWDTSAATPPGISSPMCSSDGAFQATVTGQPGKVYVIESSVDLINWTPCSTNTLSGSIWTFVDPGTASSNCKFYRAVCPPQ